MTSMLHVLDRTGDSRITWNPNNREEVELARKAFADAKDKKMLIYKTDADGNRGEKITTFDPQAKRIVCVPQTVGG